MEIKIKNEEKLVEILTYCLYYFEMHDIKNDNEEVKEWFKYTWNFNLNDIFFESISKNEKYFKELKKYFKSKINKKFVTSKGKNRFKNITKALKNFIITPAKLSRSCDYELFNKNSALIKTRSKEKYFDRWLKEFFNIDLDTKSLSNATGEIFYKINEKLDNDKISSTNNLSNFILKGCFLYLLRAVNIDNNKIKQNNYILAPIPEVKQVVETIKRKNLSIDLILDISTILIEIPHKISLNFNKLSNNVKKWDENLKFFDFENIFDVNLKTKFTKIKSLYEDKTQTLSLNYAISSDNISFDNLNILALIIFNNSIFIIDKNFVYKIDERIFSIFKNQFFLKEKAFVKSDDFMICYVREFLGIFKDFIHIAFKNNSKSDNNKIIYFLEQNFNYKNSKETNKNDNALNNKNIFDKHKQKVKNAFDKAKNLAKNSVDESRKYLYDEILETIKSLEGLGYDKFKLYRGSYINKDMKNSINFDNLDEFYAYLDYLYKLIIAAIEFVLDMENKKCPKDMFISSMKKYFSIKDAI